MDTHFKICLKLRQKLRGVLRSRCIITRQRESVLRRLHEAAQGFCLRVIVNEFHPNLEKTTSCVLSVLLINLWFYQKHFSMKKTSYKQKTDVLHLENKNS